MLPEVARRRLLIRRRLMMLGRVVFLALTVFFAWWALRGRWDEVGHALAATPWWGLVVALLLTAAGLLATGFVWIRVLAAFGHRPGVRDALAVFFIGQLGKYVPGSVWSIGVQADLARRHAVPVRITVGTSLVFLGYHLVTAVLVGALTALTGAIDTRVPDWLLVVAAAASVLAMAPVLVNRLGSTVAGPQARLRLGPADTVVVVGLMTLAWAGYALALLAVVPSPEPGILLAIAGAFAVAYALGVVIVLAPAGLGAREATFVLLLTPALGLGTATSVALVSRVLHTVADFGWAALAHRLAVRART